MKAMHLVSLSGARGDNEHKLIGPKTFNWLFTGFHSTKSGYDEKVPSDVAEEFSAFNPNWQKETENESGEFHITVGTPDNDRALSAIGMSFDSASKACKWAIENQIELGEDYEGGVY